MKQLTLNELKHLALSVYTVQTHEDQLACTVLNEYDDRMGNYINEVIGVNEYHGSETRIQELNDTKKLLDKLIELIEASEE
ncbi:hypothetical protein [Psychrobacillus phage Perkons]|nr:hypothetical protein [Psychrobacillus phage Perkons]